MWRTLRIGLIAVVISAAASVGALATTAGAAQPCLPPPNLVLVQVAQVAGPDSPLFADVQAVEQAAATQGDRSGSQVIQDILVVVNRSGYQWDCNTSRLTSTRPGTSAGSTLTTQASSSDTRTSVQVQAAPAAGTTSPSRLPIFIILAGLAVCSAGLVIAVRRVSRH
jgi:hypothetical protein